MLSHEFPLDIQFIPPPSLQMGLTQDTQKKVDQKSLVTVVFFPPGDPLSKRSSFIHTKVFLICYYTLQLKYLTVKN